MSNLHILVDKLGFTQESLAKELGVTRSTVTRWLSGVKQPSIKHAVKIINIAKKYKIKIDLNYIYGVEK